MNKGRHGKRFLVTDAHADELCEHYRKTLSPVHVQPLTAGGLISVKDVHHCLGEWSVWGGACQSGMKVGILEGASDSMVLYLPTSGLMELEMISSQLHSVPGYAIFADLNQIKTLTLGPERSHIGVAFDHNCLRKTLSAMTSAPLGGNITFTPYIDLATFKGRQLALLVQYLWKSLEVSECEPISRFYFTEFMTALTVMVIETVANSHSSTMDSRITAAMPRQVRKAVDFMHANASGRLTIVDIANASGASVRSLQIAFQDSQGISPIAYLRRLRLENARRELCEQGSAAFVKGIARKWGFLHMGRFIKAYYQAFGEVPIRQNSSQ